MEDGQVKRCVPVLILGVDRRTGQNEFVQNVGLPVLRSGVHEKPGILRVEQLRQSPPSLDLGRTQVITPELEGGFYLIRIRVEL